MNSFTVYEFTFSQTDAPRKEAGKSGRDRPTCSSKHLHTHSKLQRV